MVIPGPAAFSGGHWRCRVAHACVIRNLQSIPPIRGNARGDMRTTRAVQNRVRSERARSSAKEGSQLARCGFEAVVEACAKRVRGRRGSVREPVRERVRDRCGGVRAASMKRVRGRCGGVLSWREAGSRTTGPAPAALFRRCATDAHAVPEILYHRAYRRIRPPRDSRRARKHADRTGFT